VLGLLAAQKGRRPDMGASIPLIVGVTLSVLPVVRKFMREADQPAVSELNTGRFAPPVAPAGEQANPLLLVSIPAGAGSASKQIVKLDDDPDPRPSFRLLAKAAQNHNRFAASNHR
jgi:hypothetical protein